MKRRHGCDDCAEGVRTDTMSWKITEGAPHDGHPINHSGLGCSSTVEKLLQRALVCEDEPDETSCERGDPEDCETRGHMHQRHKRVLYFFGFVHDCVAF